MNSEISMRLRSLRNGRSAKEVANACGISTSALAMYETGKRIPKDTIKIRLAKYYNVSVETLFFTNQEHDT